MSRLKKLVLMAVGLLAVAVAVNLSDPTHSLGRLARRQTTIKAQVAQHFGKVRPLKPLGSETAKVKLTVYVQSTNHCHEPTINTCQKIAQAVPKRVRVEFFDTATAKGAQAAQKDKIGCETGILVNGRGSFEVKIRGKKTQVGFHGPVGMGTPPDLVRAVIDQELDTQYGKRLTPQERTKLAAAWKSLPKGQMAPGGHGMPGGKGGMPGPGGSPPLTPDGMGKGHAAPAGPPADKKPA